MALVIVEYTGNCNLPVKNCDTVTLCLDSSWEAKTVSGCALVQGKVQTTIKTCLDAPANPCDSAASVGQVTACTYHLTVDNTQFIDDPATGLPYVLTSSDIEDIFPYECIAGQICTNTQDIATNAADIQTIFDTCCEDPPPANPFSLDFIYGDGSDGDWTITSTDDFEISDFIYPPRGLFLDNLTIDAGGVLRMWGTWNFAPPNPSDPESRYYYPIFVKDTLTINGTINVDGNPGTSSAGARSAGCKSSFQRSAGGGTVTFGGIAGHGNALNGPGGGADSGGCGGAGTDLPEQTNQAGTSCYGARSVANVSGDGGPGMMGGGLGGDGGAGGSIAADAGGAGGTNTIPSDATPYKIGRFVLNLIEHSAGNLGEALAVIGGGSGGAGGGGGGGTEFPAGVGGMGGGGGAGGGTILLFAKNIVIGAAGLLTANGGDGADGSDATGPFASGGGGGAGGGGGGLIYLAYKTFSNAGTFSVLGGAAGAAGADISATVASVAGTAGADGNVYLMNTTTGLIDTLSP